MQLRVLMILLVLFWPSNSNAQSVQDNTLIGGLTLNGFLVIGTNTSGGDSTTHSYKIATLNPDNLGGHGHLHVLMTLNCCWASGTNSYIDAVFANRAGFTYQYTVRGASVTGLSPKLAAYKKSDNTVDIYIMFVAGAYGWSNAGYTVLENEQGVVYPSPTDLGTIPPQGMLVFDSSSSNYSPVSYTDFDGNQALKGNLKLTQGSGATITFSDGTNQNTASNGTLCGGDYAESVDVSGDRKKYEPGDVLVIDPKAEGKFLKSAEPYSTGVMGIYSTKPGLTGRRQMTTKSPDEVPMAMMGIVPIKVSKENDPIHPGDLLVTSSTPGYAMKGTDRGRMVGALIGKALGSLESATGVIEVGVTLQ